MLYFLAIVMPPLAVLFARRPGAAILNAFLCLFLWVPGVVHAVLIINEVKADRRARKYGCAPR
ncbi:MAG TPA: YqaE/Pmp3 family membrane protein [Dehalococcoidia bacterium]